MNKYTYYAIWSVLVILLTIPLCITYLLIFPLKAATIANDPFPILTPTVKAGEGIRFHSEFCLHTNVAAQISRSLIGETIHILSPTQSTLKKGCYSLDGAVIIPQGIPKGKYRLETLYEYKVNWLKTISVSAATQEFEVIK